MLRAFSIDDDLNDQNSMAIEVTLHLENGSRRWCYFMTPTALASCGDYLDDAKVRFHYGAPHMIVVAGSLDALVIERILRRIEGEGRLEACSLQY